MSQNALVNCTAGAAVGAVVGAKWGAAGGTLTLPGFGTVAGAAGLGVAGAAGGCLVGLLTAPAACQEFPIPPPEPPPGPPGGGFHVAVIESDVGASGRLRFLDVQFQPPQWLYASFATGRDAIVRAFERSLFVVNRLERDSTIERIDLTGTFRIDPNLHAGIQFSLGQRLLPQDILLFSAEKAYVTLSEPSPSESDILVIDPQTGDVQRKIDLNPYITNKDGAANATVMTPYDYYQGVPSLVAVAVQDLDGASANASGKVVIVATDLDAVTATVELKGRRPVAMAYDDWREQICVSNAGTYDLADDYGGVECFKTAELRLGQTHRSTGMLVPDEVLGGVPGDLTFNGVHIDVVTQAVGTTPGGDGPSQVTRFFPEPGKISPDKVFKMYESTGRIPDIAWIESHECVLVADRDRSKLVCIRVPGEIPWEVPSVDAPPSSLAIY